MKTKLSLILIFVLFCTAIPPVCAAGSESSETYSETGETTGIQYVKYDDLYIKKQGDLAEVGIADNVKTYDDMILFAACYDSNETLLRYSFGTVFYNLYDAENSECSVNISAEDASEIKVFVWSDLGNMIPGCRAAKMTIEKVPVPTATPVPTALPTATPMPETTASPTAVPDLDEYREEVTALVNKYRAEEGLSALTLDSTISEAADARAKEITELFSHTRPDGTSCFSVLGEYNISFMFAGENIAYGQKTPDEVVTAWMNSVGHRENIMNVNYDEIGVGICRYNNKYYWVQIFIGGRK